MLVRWLLSLLLLVAPAAGAGQTILVFGDSLSANYGIAAEAGWVSLLQQRLSSKPYNHRLVNASISGETTAGGAARINATLNTHKPDIVIIELGVNDGLRGRSLSAAKDNLDTIMAACLARKTRVLLIGMRLPSNYGLTYTESFAAIYPALAAKHGTALLPFMLEGMASRRDGFQEDNLHPTAEAQVIIMESIWVKLKHLL
ncbi:MAG: arylesterase [Sulfuricellaceae bacterium]|nr:arylesterase [Sulfuricellaceae bacterium]